MGKRLIPVNKNDLIKHINKTKKENEFYTISRLCELIENTEWAKGINLKKGTVLARLKSFNLYDDVKKYIREKRANNVESGLQNTKLLDPVEEESEKFYHIIKKRFGFGGKRPRCIITPCGSCPIKIEKPACNWVESMIEWGLQNGIVFSPNALRYFINLSNIKEKDYWINDINNWFNSLEKEN